MIKPAIRWGIIGCGNVTEVKSGPAFQKTENSSLIAVMRRNGELAKDYAVRHGVPRWYDKAEHLINDPEVDAVYVATPPSTHAEYTIKALRAGKPVYVEKPMAMTYSDCQKMNEASVKHGVPLFVAYYRRALPGFLKVNELVNKGRLGKIRTVNLQLYKPLTEAEQSENKPWRVDPLISGGGHFVDLASHQLDFLDFLLGPVIRTTSIAVNQAGVYDAEDMVSASFLFENNVVVNGTWCFNVAEFLRRDVIEIIGDKGMIRFSCFGFEPVKLHTVDGIESWKFPKPEHVQQELIRKVVGELTGKDHASSTGISGSRTTRLIEEVLKEYYQ